MRILLLLLIANTALGQSFFTTISGSCVSDSPVELGMKFTTSANAQVNSLRFYKCSAGTQVYTLKLYSGSTLLTSATYTGTATGWINVPIPSVQVIPGVTYTVSYYSTIGMYQAANPYVWPVKNGPLTASGSVYAYKTTNSNTLPTSTYLTSNYFADVVVQNNVPNNVHDTIYLRDTVVLPCYPPDSSLIITNGNTIEKYFYFFKTVYRDTGRIVYNNVYIRDTVYITKLDTAYLPKVCPTDSQHYLTDTIYLPCRDTTHVLITWDAYDTTNYKTFFDNFFEVEYMTLPNGQKYRFKAKIEKHWYKEQWDDLLQQWK